MGTCLGEAAKAAVHIIDRDTMAKIADKPKWHNRVAWAIEIPPKDFLSDCTATRITRATLGMRFCFPLSAVNSGGRRQFCYYGGLLEVHCVLS
jgi:hypothetical protein